MALPHFNKLMNSVHWNMLCTKFGWNWPFGSGEDFKILLRYFHILVVIIESVFPYIWIKFKCCFVPSLIKFAQWFWKQSWKCEKFTDRRTYSIWYIFKNKVENVKSLQTEGHIWYIFKRNLLYGNRNPVYANFKRCTSITKVQGNNHSITCNMH